MTISVLNFSEYTVKLDNPANNIEIVKEGDELPVVYFFTTNSEYVVNAVLESVKIIGKSEKKEKDENRIDFGDAFGGTLYKFKTEKVLCSQNLLNDALKEPLKSPEHFYIFVPAAERQQELYIQNNQYLLFLKSAEKQEEITSQYLLDKSIIYYRALEGKRSLFDYSEESTKGIVDLTKPNNQKLGGQITVISTALCQPKKMRLRELSKLKHSNDKVINENALFAIKELER